jgi:hypothetical protein
MPELSPANFSVTFNEKNLWDFVRKKNKIVTFPIFSLKSIRQQGIVVIGRFVGCHDNQQNDTQQNDSQQNDIQQNDT